MTDPAVVTVTPVASPVKAGYKTTEGWLAFAIAVLGAATGTGFVGTGSTAASVCGLAMSALTAIVYTWSRTTVKAAA